MRTMLARLLALVAIAAGLVAVADSPAFAGTCSSTVSCYLQNNSSIQVQVSDDWCWGNLESNTFENFPPTGCPGHGYQIGPGQRLNDADAYQPAGGCITQSEIYWYGSTGGVLMATYTDNRVGLPSFWRRFHNDQYAVITSKQCFAPAGLTVWQVTSNTVALRWDSMPGLTESGGVYHLFRNNVLISGDYQGLQFTDTQLSPSTQYYYTISASRAGYEYPRSSAVGAYTDPTAPPPPAGAPSYVPIPPGTWYWVNTFASAPGQFDTTVVGTLYAGNNYVYCKAWAGEVRFGDAYNSWWLWTDLDTGGSAWVSAYYLTYWGNNEAYDNWGNDIPDC